MKRQTALTLVITGLLAFTLAACALTDVKTTPPPPVTLKAPPQLNFTGNCDNFKDLENWLQITSGILSEFRTLMTDTASKTPGEVTPGLMRMAQLRDSVFLAATPDCGHDAQVLLSDAMNKAVQYFQMFANGESIDISARTAEISISMDQVAEMEAALTARLQEEIQERIQATATPQSSGG